jgi:CRP-like cAMP-binding protein
MEESVRRKLDNFFKQGVPLRFRRKDFLIRATDTLGSVYYLTSGRVRQFIDTKNGLEITFHVFMPPSFFPIMIFLSKTKNKYNFQALEEVTVWKMPSQRVIEFLKEEPEVLLDLAVRLSQGIIGLLEKLEKMSFTTAYQKVISELMYIMQKESSKEHLPNSSEIKLTHTLLASRTGLQRETVSRQIEKLIHKGIITKKATFLAVNPAKLQEEYEKTY